MVQSYGTQVLWPDHCVQGTDDAALHKGLKLPTAQIIVRKGYHKSLGSYCALEETDHKTTTGLAGYLKQRGIKTVFVTGLEADERQGCQTNPVGRFRTGLVLGQKMAAHGKP